MRTLRFHKYLPMACIFFFINSMDFFPHGMLITTVLAPFFYIWLLLKRQRYVLEVFFAVLFPFAFAADITGMQKINFLTSCLLLMTAYVTVYAVTVAIRETHSLDEVFRTLIWLNVAFAFVGLLVRFTPLVHFLWQMPGDVDNTTGMTRFRGFTYEPSHYSTLLVPLVLYSYWLHVQKRTWYTLGLLIGTTIPLLMAFSFGAIGVLFVAVFTVQLIRHRTETRFIWVTVVTVGVLGGYFALPSTSHTKLRIDKIINGNDNSANTRTTEAYASAYAMARSRDIWLGCGLGSQKTIGVYFISQNQGGLHDAIAETLADLGLIGVALRLGLEIYFFFKTRPDRDPYRLSLFIWVFIFQFGASYNSNVAEYLVWILAFSPNVGYFSAREPEPVEEASSYAVPQLT